MSIALDAPAAHTPSVMRSALLRRKIRDRCVRSSVSLAAGSYEKRRKVSITVRLRRQAASGGGDRESRSERSSRGYQEILRVETATHRTVRSGGVFGMLHRTTGRRADLIEGTVDSIRPLFHQKNSEPSLPISRYCPREMKQLQTREEPIIQSFPFGIVPENFLSLTLRSPMQTSETIH